MHTQQLFTRVRDDLRASAANEKWTDVQVYRYLDRAYQKVWGEQITLFESWQVKRATVDLVANTELVSLPVDLKKVCLVEYLMNGVYYPLTALDFKDHYKVKQFWPVIDATLRFYYLLDAQIGILPVPSGNVTAGLRITYYPKAGNLHYGIVAGVGSGTVTLASDASVEDDAYNGQYLAIVSGTGAGKKAQITDYVGSTKVATVTFAVPPIAGSTYALYPKSESELDELIILQTAQELTVVQDPGVSKLFAELYSRERERRVDELATRDAQPQYIKFTDTAEEA